MPAFVTHVLFGELVAGDLPEGERLLIEANPAPFFWGLQGPDLLFFRDAVRGKSPLPQVGGVMHREKTDKLLEGFARYILRAKRDENPQEDALLSYFMGFLCHYALDATTHPYIYYLQERKKYYVPREQWGGIHHLVESHIDSALYPIVHNKSVRRFAIPRSFKRPEQEAAIARMYRHVIWQVYGQEFSTLEIARCFDDTRLLMKATLEPTGALLAAVQTAERLILRKPNSLSAHIRRAKVEEDILNQSKGLWAPLYDPDNPRSESFLELVEEARRLADTALPQWFAAAKGGPVPQWAGCPSFDNGRPEYSHGVSI